MKLKQHLMFFLILLLILVSCAALWQWAGYSVTQVPADGGVRDLTGADFDSVCFDLFGPVEYIPNALLTPGEFEAKRDEIKIGDPEKEAAFSTSRVRIYVPTGTYGLMLWNAEYAARIYINGQFMESVGVPGSAAEDSTANVRLLFYTVEAASGVIELVQQASSFVASDGDSHANIIIGKPDIVRKNYDKQKELPAILMGCFLALALAFLVLYSLLPVYRANLWFSAFCFTWFIRTGCISPWVLSTFLPLPGMVILSGLPQRAT